MRIKGRGVGKFAIFTVLIAVVALNVSMECASASPIYVPEKAKRLNGCKEDGNPKGDER
jgi:hypothetical protein